MPIERWKKTTIDSNYEVSTLGNVRSVDRVVVRNDGRIKRFKGRILKKQKWTSGYLFITISSIEFGRKQYSIHRLVALVWRKNPLNLPQVNHKDGKKWNNYYTNLEWCTQGENNEHSYKTGLKIHHRCWKGKKGYYHNRSKEVIEYDFISKKETNRYGSTSEAARIIGCHPGTIQNCCKGKQKKHLCKSYKYAD